MIFDTNIFIYAHKKQATAQALLINTENRAISAVTYMEYVPFCRNKKELLAFNELLCTSNGKHFAPVNGLKLEIYSPLLETGE